MALYLAGFGKHPAWNDHIDPPLGIETQRLVDVRRVLYIEGIGGNIDSGEWDQLDEEEQLPGLHHVFLWHTPGDIVVGRMWPSSDGRGRKKYPMIVCAQCRGMSLSWVLRHVLPGLEQLEKRCGEATSAGAVQSILDEARNYLRSELSGSEPVKRPVEPIPDLLSRLAGHADMGPDHVGLHRVLYRIHSEMSDYRRGSEAIRGGSLRPQQMRVPPCGTAPGLVLQQWSVFLHDYIDAQVPMLLLLPLDPLPHAGAWIDLMVGEPTRQQFFCLKATPRMMPLDTAIPYRLDDAFVAETEKKIGNTPARPTGGAGAAGAGAAAGAAAAGGPSAGAAAAKPQPGETAASSRPVPTPPRDESAPAQPRQGEAMAPQETEPAASSDTAAEQPPVTPPPARAIPPADAQSAPQPAPAPAAPISQAPPDESPDSKPPSGAASGGGFKMLLLLLLVALIGGGVALFATGALDGVLKPGGSFDHAAWARWCNAYDGWLGALARMDDEQRRRLAADPHLAPVIAAVEQAGSADFSLDPRQVIGQRDADLAQLARQAPSQARDPPAVTRTQHAGELIDRVEKTIDGWPDLLLIRQSTSAFKDRDWRQAAGRLDRLAGPLEPGDSFEPTPENLLAVSQTAGAVRRIRQAWPAVKSSHDAMRAVAAVDDPVAQAFIRYLGDGARHDQADIEQLAAHAELLAPLAADAGRIVREDWSRIDHAAFRADSAVHQTPGDKLSLEHFAQWRDEAAGYYIPTADDPRPVLRQSHAQLNEAFDKLRAGDYAPPAEVSQALTEAGAELAALDRLPWIAKHADEVRQRSAALDRSLRELSLTASRASQQVKGAAMRDTVAKLAHVAPSGSKPIDAAWVKQRDELLAGGSSEELLTLRVNKLRTFLIETDEAFKSQLAGVEATTGWGKALHEDVIAPRRDAAMTKLLEQVRWIDGQPATDDDFASQRKQSADAFNAWFDRLAELAAHLPPIAQTLAELRPIDESPAPGQPTASQRMAMVVQHPLHEDEAVRRAVAPVVERVRAIEKLHALEDVQRLTAAAAGADGQAIEQRLAAWRRVSELPAPATVEAFAAQRDAARALQAALDNVQNEAAGQAKQRVGEAVRARFIGLLEAVDDAGQFEAAAQMMEGHDVAADDLSPRGQFNLLLRDLRQVEREADEAQAKAAIDAFAAPLAQLPDDFRARDEVRAFAASLAALNEAGTNAAGAVDPMRIGPAGAPVADKVAWQTRIEDDGERVIFTWAPPGGGRTHTLVFLRVEPGDGAAAAAGVQPFYLCTTEVSAGLFIDVISAAEQWPAYRGDRMLREFQHGSTRSQFDRNAPAGPCVWRWRNPGQPGPIVVSERWLTSLWSFVVDPYPAEQAPPAPSADHPMQQVSPLSAAWFAAQMGCRLPTPAQWRAAHAKLASPGETNWNVRDAKWTAHVAHLATLQDDRKQVKWPDDDAFIPRELTSSPRGRRAEPAVSIDDGHLWFAPVGSDTGQPFRHMVGNVAEFVLDLPDDALSPVGSDEELTLDHLAQLIEQSPQSMSVIGGSALSLPQASPDQPYTLASPLTSAGFSDVGFRLAFTEPNYSLAQKLVSAVKRQGYLFK